MKLRIRSLFTILFLTGAVLCATAGLTSCENFLRGADVKKQLEDSIKYANAQSCRLYLKSNAEIGSFISGNQIDCKVGFSTDIQFSLKQNDYYFISLEAVSSIDENQSRNDYVEFTINENKSDFDRGIYVITVKLLKAADDILIRPKCLEIPCIKTYSPSGTKTQYSNTPIVITFSVPVEDETVLQADSIFNYDNIKITATNVDYSSVGDSFDGDMRDFFYLPEFNSQKTVLTLFPRAELLKEFISNLQGTFLEINVSFSNITIRQGELEFSLKDGAVSELVVRYNSTTENIAPEKKEFFITDEEITLADAAFFEEGKKYKESNITSHGSSSTIGYTKDRLAPSTVYIYGKYFDQDSGVAEIEVSEYLEHTNSESSLTLEPIVTSFSIREKNDSVSFYEDGTGYTSFVIKYVIQENLKPSPLYGLISINVLVKDLCGNSSEQISVFLLNMENCNITYYTAWNKGTNAYPYKTVDGYNYLKATPFDVCNAPSSKTSSAQGSYDFAQYNKDIKTIRIKDEYKPSLFFLRENIQPTHLTPTSSFKDNIIYCYEVDYVCEYIHRDGEKRRDPFTPYNPDTMERTVTLDVDKVAGMSFDIIPLYQGRPVGRWKFTFPDKPLLSSIDGTYIKVAPAESQDGSESETMQRLALCKYPDNSYKMVFINNGSVTKNNIPDDCSCYLFYARLNGKNQTFPNVKYYFDNSSQTYKEDTTAVSTELGYDFQSTTTWFDRGLMSELLGPYSKTQSTADTPTTPVTTISKSLGNNDYINVTLEWDSNIWDIYDTLECKLDTTLVTIRETDTFINDEGTKVCFTIPVESTKFFSVDSYSVKDEKLEYWCRGIKNNITSQKETKQVSLSTQEKTDLDNIKPSILYFNGIVSNAQRPACEFLFYDYGSGPRNGEIRINNNYYNIVYTKQGKDNCFATTVDVKDLNWGNNTIKYKLKDRQENTTEGTISFNLPENLELTHKCVKSVTISGNTFTATIENVDGKFKDKVNSGDAVLTVYGCIGNVWYTDNPIATFSSTNPIPSNQKISFLTTRGESSKYDFVNIIYSSKYQFDSIIYGTETFDAESSNNFVIPNGTKKDSVVIYSNNSSKVLVYIYKVRDNSPYKDLCQNWNEDKWKLYGERDMSQMITVTPKTPTVFTNDTLQKHLNGCNYCVIAHFANGDCVASPVMHY